MKAADGRAERSGVGAGETRAETNARPKVAARSVAELLAADSAFSRTSEEEGAGAAFLEHASDGIRFLRLGIQPLLGKMAVTTALAGAVQSSRWVPAGAGVAASGDLGYTYGAWELGRSEAERKPGASGSYLRVWERRPNDPWRVALDLALPTPPPAPSE